MAAAEEKVEAPSLSSAPPSGGGGKVVTILSVVNLLVTMGMFGILFISFNREKKSTSVEDINTHTDTHAAAKDGAKGGEHGGGHGGGAPDGEKKKLVDFGKMVTLDQFTVNLSTPGSVNPKYVRVAISLEVPNEEASEEVQTKLPQVRNAIIDLFNSKKMSDLANVEGRENLKEEIKNALNSFLVTGKVRGVFFTNFALAG